MANVPRLGDFTLCGDYLAQGSPNVFFDGMPVATSAHNKTTGHGCWPPTFMAGPWADTVKVNGDRLPIAFKTRILVHCCGKSCHDALVNGHGPTVSVEET